MKISLLKALLEETDLSAELLGQRFEMSGMTIRRLLAARKGEVPSRHEQNILNGVYRLIAEGRLSPGSSVAKSVFEAVQPASFDAAIRSLGLSDFKPIQGPYGAQVNFVLNEIGRAGERQRSVKGARRELSRFKKFGTEWSERIGTLLGVVRSSKLKLSEKFVAFGGLFYLVEPFDLMPDGIPVFGFLDDFGVLGYAAMHYTSKVLGLGRRTVQS